MTMPAVVTAEPADASAPGGKVVGAGGYVVAPAETLSDVGSDVGGASGGDFRRPWRHPSQF
jgi:hypothetical protein